MSTKVSIAAGKNFHFYNEVSLDFDPPDRVFVELDETTRLLVDQDKDWNNQLRVTLAIPNETMDQIAIAWIKHRRLQGAVGGPVGHEWGSPDCPWD